MTAAPPPLAPDLVAGLRRLKLAAIRPLAPELLITAKTQRWAPEELLRTLIEAEITARVLHPRPPPGLPRQPGMYHRRREPLPGRPARHRQEPCPGLPGHQRHPR